MYSNLKLVQLFSELPKSLNSVWEQLKCLLTDEYFMFSD